MSRLRGSGVELGVFGGSGMLGLVVEPGDLAARLGDEGLLLVDLCRGENWRRGHVPGALHVEPAELVSGVPPATGRLPELARLEAIFSRLGYAADKHLVAYDDEGGGWAGRFIWTLDVIGHGGGASYLNGGLVAWAKEGFPLTTEVAEVAPTQVSLAIHREPIAEKEDVLAALGRKDTVIWDARSPEEWAGTRVEAARGGQIPGAVNLDWLEMMDSSRNLRLRQDLAALLAERGIRPGAKVITHCQTHHRSGLAYLVGKLLGLDIKGYHGSWSEWGNDPDTPIDKPAGKPAGKPKR